MDVIVPRSVVIGTRRRTFFLWSAEKRIENLARTRLYVHDPSLSNEGLNIKMFDYTDFNKEKFGKNDGFHLL